MKTLRTIIATLIVVALGVAGLIWFGAPRLAWNATAVPGATERLISRHVIGGWVRGRASALTNPLAPSADNLREGQQEYQEHCATCHGATGNGINEIGGDFYPPIPKLTGGAQRLDDGRLFFLISNGIRYTAMPGFGVRHTPDKIWKIMLWMRQLGKNPSVTPPPANQPPATAPQAATH